MIDSINKLLRNNQVTFDMYNNSNSDVYKSKYNSLIYFLAVFITGLKQNYYSKKEKNII